MGRKQTKKEKEGRRSWVGSNTVFAVEKRLLCFLILKLRFDAPIPKLAVVHRLPEAPVKLRTTAPRGAGSWAFLVGCGAISRASNNGPPRSRFKAGKESGFGRRASYPAVGGRRMGLNFFFWDILQ